MTTQTRKGGARKGSGRPLRGAEALSERITFRLTKSELRDLEDAAKNDGQSAAHVARRCMLEAIKRLKHADIA